MIESIDISVIILTWNSERSIGPCLESVIRDLGSSGYHFEVFVVDNGSTDSTGQIVRAAQSGRPGTIRAIFLDKNAGTTYPRNLALKKARGRYLCFVDSDVYISAPCFKHLIAELESGARIGIVAPMLVYPDGRLQKSTDELPTVLSKIRRFLFLRDMESREPLPVRGAVGYAISAFWIFKRQVMDAVGLLDEKIFYSPEDVDYCFRVWNAGFSVLYCPSVAAVHDAQEISRGYRITPAKLHHIYGLFYYFLKSGYLFHAPALACREPLV